MRTSHGRLKVFIGLLFTMECVFAVGLHSKIRNQGFQFSRINPNSKKFKLISRLSVKKNNLKHVLRRSQVRRGLRFSLENSIQKLRESEKFQKSVQRHSGIEVFGSRVIKHFIRNKHISTFSKTIPVQGVANAPLLSSAQAKSIAGYGNGKAKLVIYPQEGKGILAWKVEEVAFASRNIYFINAQTGKVIDSFNGLTSAQMEGEDSTGNFREFSGKIVDGSFQLFDEEWNVKTYQHKSGKSLPGVLVKYDSPVIDEPAAVDVHYYTSKVLELLKEKFDRNGYDGNFADVISTVLYVQSGDSYINAFWNGRQLVYGKGDNELASDLSGALDVIAHELAHAITEKTNRLVYRNESGALNEAFSDILGTYFEYLIQPEKFDWKIGEDVWTPQKSGDALRYMNDPVKDERSRDHYSTRYTGFSDNGGVHINSGIANLAFYLLSEGGSHPRRNDEIEVEGIGIDNAAQIFYKGFTQLLSPNATFKDARDATVYVARLESFEVALEVHNAWKAVGVDGEVPTPDEDDGNDDGNDDGDDEDDNPGDPEEPAPVKKEFKNEDSISIPDRKSKGINSFIEIPDNVNAIEVVVNIEHSYIGDLYVTLYSPEGKRFRLHKRTGGKKDNIFKRWRAVLPAGAKSKGEWRLHISDNAFFDKGSLKWWSISYTK